MKTINLTLFSIAAIILVITAQPVMAGSQIYYVHNDHLSTPKMMTDEQGTKVWEATHTPFGDASVAEDVDHDGEIVTLNIRFPGQYYDQETGLHYNWNRYYNPQTGRYITSDPIGLAGGINTYGYVGQNPILNTDITGLHHQGTGCVGQSDNRTDCPPDKCTTANCVAGLPDPQLNDPNVIIPTTACEWTCFIGTLTCGLADGPGLIADGVCGAAAYQVCVTTSCNVNADECVGEDVIEFLDDSILF